MPAPVNRRLPAARDFDEVGACIDRSLVGFDRVLGVVQMLAAMSDDGDGIGCREAAASKDEEQEKSCDGR
jgi:hypothetical protein